MKTLLVMDEKNYDQTLPEIRRTAVRAITFIDGRLLLIRSSYGEVKLPGGGQEAGESDIDTLIRETLEETGYHVIPESVRPFGEIEERRLSSYEDRIWHQFNRYYFCDTGPDRDECNFSESEKKRGFSQVLLTLDEAIKVNGDLLAREGFLPWNQREYNLFRILKQYLSE